MYFHQKQTKELKIYCDVMKAHRLFIIFPHVLIFFQENYLQTDRFIKIVTNSNVMFHFQGTNKLFMMWKIDVSFNNHKEIRDS